MTSQRQHRGQSVGTPARSLRRLLHHRFPPRLWVTALSPAYWRGIPPRASSAATCPLAIGLST